MENIRLTIITPVFNGSRYILNCLENVAGQVVPGIEHLIMDGASTDGTAEIAMEYAGKYPHVRVVSEKDKGQSDAMNKGIQAAKGSVIGFLNVDDFYEPGVLSRVSTIFESLPEPAFICGNLNIWNEDGSLRHLGKPSRVKLVEIISNCYDWPYNPSSYFYHKSLHDKIGLYNEDNHFLMDFEFILKAAHAVKFKYFDEIWGNFALIQDSKTNIRQKNEQDKLELKGNLLREQATLWLTPEEKQELEALKQNQLINNSANNSQKKTIRKTIKRIFRIFSGLQ